MKKLALEGGKPVRTKEDFLVFGAPLIEEPEIEEVVACMRSRWIGTGPRVCKFEEDFAAYKGVEHAIALNSCTAALHLAMFASGIGPGDEVMQSHIFLSPSVSLLGRRP